MDKNSTVVIVGLGVIGASYAMALTNAGYEQVYGVDSDTNTLTKAVAGGIIKDGDTDGKNFVANADILVLALYPAAVVPYVTAVAGVLKKGALVTDVTGIKSVYSREISRILPDYVDYVPAHPMAGREKKGIDYASAEVFKGANFIIVPVDRTSREGIDTVRTLAKDMGFGTVRELSADKHDEIIAYTSQLPHAIAVALINSDSEDSDTGDYIGDSYRDLTRIANINAALWQELFIGNKDNLLLAIDRFENQLRAIREAVMMQDGEELEKMFGKSTLRRIALNKEKS